jgi:hypothetical protein
MKSRLLRASSSPLWRVSSGAGAKGGKRRQNRSTAAESAAPALRAGVEHGVEQAVAVDAEHQPVVIARQHRTGMPALVEDARHAFGLGAARQVHHVAQMQERLARMTLQRPLQDAAAEQRLLGRTLRHFDEGIDRAVVVMQRVAGGLVLLRVADGGERRRQRLVAPRRVGRWSRLRHEAGTACKA